MYFDILYIILMILKRSIHIEYLSNLILILFGGGGGVRVETFVKKKKNQCQYFYMNLLIDDLDYDIWKEMQNKQSQIYMNLIDFQHPPDP